LRAVFGGQRQPLADDGVAVWDDMVKGRIAIGNAELDDLVIARSDGTPTYNPRAAGAPARGGSGSPRPSL